jgi:histidyl-tRNA synthetase
MKGFGVSAGGGGRYDDLIGMFSGRKIPACGFSLGLERIILLMQERDMFPEDMAGKPELMVALFSEELMPANLELTHRLRREGFRVDLYPEPGKYGKQFKYAEQRGIRHVVLQGPDEIEKGIIILKDLKSGSQKEITLDGELKSLEF